MLPSNQASVKRTTVLDTAPEALLRRMPPGPAAALRQVVALAAERGAHVWLVGGVVRDLLLGLALSRDVDLAVEGDALALAQALVAVGGRLIASHREFGTASVAFASAFSPAGDLTIDLAQARVESYPRPAMLPLVRPAAIADDLVRRDFSTNAIAIELRADGEQLQAGQLIDPFGGRADLAAGRLRLLHPLSLRDDPTRILRGLRLASRLGLAPDDATAAQIAGALRQGYLGLLSPDRILAELCLALAEPRPDAALAISDAWGVTPQILPGLAWSAALEARFARFAASGPPAQGSGIVAAGLICYDLSADELAAIAGRYPLPGPIARLLAEIPAARAAARTLDVNMRPSQIDALMRAYGEPTVSVLHYAEPGYPGQMAAHYLDHIRPARPPLDGRDLQRLGVAPGPAIGRLLAGLRAAYLDGAIAGRVQAEQWVRTHTS